MRVVALITHMMFSDLSNMYTVLLACQILFWVVYKYYPHSSSLT